MNIRPPQIPDNWNDCTPTIQADLLAYNQIRNIEEDQRFELILKAIAGRGGI